MAAIAAAWVSLSGTVSSQTQSHFSDTIWNTLIMPQEPLSRHWSSQQEFRGFASDRFSDLTNLRSYVESQWLSESVLTNMYSTMHELRTYIPNIEQEILISPELDLIIERLKNILNPGTTEIVTCSTEQEIIDALKRPILEGKMQQTLVVKKGTYDFQDYLNISSSNRNIVGVGRVMFDFSQKSKPWIIIGKMEKMSPSKEEKVENIAIVNIAIKCNWDMTTGEAIGGGKLDYSWGIETTMGKNTLTVRGGKGIFLFGLRFKLARSANTTIEGGSHVDAYFIEASDAWIDGITAYNDDTLFNMKWWIIQWCQAAALSFDLEPLCVVDRVVALNNWSAGFFRSLQDAQISLFSLDNKHYDIALYSHGSTVHEHPKTIPRNNKILVELQPGATPRIHTSPFINPEQIIIKNHQ